MIKYKIKFMRAPGLDSSRPPTVQPWIALSPIYSNYFKSAVISELGRVSYMAKKNVILLTAFHINIQALNYTTDFWLTVPKY